MAKLAMDKVKVPVGVEVAEHGTYHAFSKNGRKVVVKGYRVEGPSMLKQLSKIMKPVSADEAKKLHLGKVRAMGRIKDEAQLSSVLHAYFRKR